MMETIILVCGGQIGEGLLDHLPEDALLVGVDRGALTLIEQGYTPDFAIGDFDSVSTEERKRIALGSKRMEEHDPILKDWTDTELAFRWAVDRAPKRILLYGVMGSRLDHTLANLHLLGEAARLQVSCWLMDANNRATAVMDTCSVQSGEFPYISLLPLTEKVTGVTLQGFKYPLQDATLQLGQTLGISNQLVQREGSVQVKSGILLVIQSKD